MNTCFESFKGFIWLKMDFLLIKHGTIIYAFVRDEVDHDACVFYLPALVGFESAFDGVNAGEYAGQCGVKIDNAIRK